MLNDFILGEQHHPLYPYKFNVEVIRRNLLNSMRSLRAHIVSLVIWFDLLISFPPLFVVHDIYVCYARVGHNNSPSALHVQRTLVLIRSRGLRFRSFRFYEQRLTIFLLNHSNAFSKDMGNAEWLYRIIGHVVKCTITKCLDPTNYVTTKLWLSL